VSLGPEAPRPTRIAIIGGGIAGLAAAHRVLEIAPALGVSVEVAVCEAADRPGGTIATERADDYLIESGPDSFLTEKPWALALCERLALAGGVIATRRDRRRTYVVRRGRLVALPDGFALMAPTRFGSVVRSRLFSWSGKARLALDLVLPRGPARDDESLGSFVTRRFGREVLERVAQPMIAGIYTADPDTLSLAATMPRFLEMERRDRSLILALLRAQRRQERAARARQESGPRWTLFAAPRGGMGTLIDTLALRLPFGAMRLGTRVRSVTAKAGAGYRVEVDGGPPLSTDGIIVAAPAHRAAALLSRLDAGLAGLLGAVPYASSVGVTFAYRREQIRHPLDGFGFVVPAIERLPLLACTFSSIKFEGRAPEGRVLLRAFLGGALRPDDIEEEDGALIGAAEGALGRLLGISGRPHLVRVHRHPKAMPQYLVGHLARVEQIEVRAARHRAFALAGSAYRGVGIPDCIRSGETAAERVLNDCAAARLAAPAGSDRSGVGG